MSSEVDIKEPITFYDQGTCPKCRGARLILRQYSDDRIKLDKRGLPFDSDSIIGECFYCPRCDFVGYLGYDIIKLEDGSYKYVTEAEKIYEENRMSKLPPVTHLHAEGNPFTDEESYHGT
jgi:hypothetical protein